jgi:hypothetical protein
MSDAKIWTERAEKAIAEYAAREEHRTALHADALARATASEDEEDYTADELRAWGPDGFAITGELTGAEIVAALDVMDREGFELPAELHEWFEKLDDLSREHSDDAVTAMALFLSASSAPKMDAYAFEDAFNDQYGQRWDSAAAWTRHEAGDQVEMGHETPEESAAARAAFDKWADFIDWDRVAVDGDIDEGYTLVQLSDDGPVYAFRDLD